MSDSSPDPEPVIKRASTMPATMSDPDPGVKRTFTTPAGQPVVVVQDLPPSPVVVPEASEVQESKTIDEPPSAVLVVLPLAAPAVVENKEDVPIVVPANIPADTAPVAEKSQDTIVAPPVLVPVAAPVSVEQKREEPPASGPAVVRVAVTPAAAGLETPPESVAVQQANTASQVVVPVIVPAEAATTVVGQPAPIVVEPPPQPVIEQQDLVVATTVEPAVVQAPVRVLEQPVSAAIVPIIETVPDKHVKVAQPAIVAPPPTLAQSPVIIQSRVDGILAPLSRRIAVFPKYIALSSTTMRFSDSMHHELLDASANPMFRLHHRHHLTDGNGADLVCLHKSLYCGR